jgi:hypothetical protein
VRFVTAQTANCVLYHEDMDWTKMKLAKAKKSIKTDTSSYAEQQKAQGK